MTNPLYWALEHVRDPENLAGLTPAARHLITLVAVFEGKGGSHPSVIALAELMGITERNVRKARAEAVRAGCLVVRPGGGRGHANTYILQSPTRSPATGFERETLSQTLSQTLSVATAQEQEQEEVLTNTDAVPRGAPPWVAQNMTAAQWIRDEIAAGRNPVYERERWRMAQ